MRATIQNSRGFTLVEVLIVVAIVAIIMVVALPAYQGQVLKTKRTVAKGELMAVLARQEQFFTNNRQYAVTLTALGYATSPYAIDSDSDEVATTSGNRVYTIGITGASATAFTLQATPQLEQTNDNCGTLQLTSLGVKSAGGANCW